MCIIVCVSKCLFVFFRFPFFPSVSHQMAKDPLRGAKSGVHTMKTKNKNEETTATVEWICVVHRQSNMSKLNWYASNWKRENQQTARTHSHTNTQWVKIKLWLRAANVAADKLCVSSSKHKMPLIACIHRMEPKLSRTKNNNSNERNYVWNEMSDENSIWRQLSRCVHHWMYYTCLGGRRATEREQMQITQ